MTTVNPAASQAGLQNQQDLWKGGAIGGLIGTFLFGNPILGALGGVAVQALFRTDGGFAESARRIIGDVTQGGDAQSILGSVLGQRSQAAEAPAERPQQQQQSGIPGWVKALGIGAAALAGGSFLQNNLFSTFLGMPYYGGFGLGYGMGYGMPYWSGFGFPF